MNIDGVIIAIPNMSSPERKTVRERAELWSRLIPLTQVRLYVVAGSHWVAPRFSSDCRV
jgi:hypothetical protein